MRLLIRVLTATILVSFFTQTVNAQTSICYKNNWSIPSKIETTKLDGGVCNGEFSYKDMKNRGWKLRDIKITKGEKGLNYSYILTDEKLVDINNSSFVNNTYTKFNYKPIFTKLENVNGDFAKVNVGNLKVGQTGVVEHSFSDDKKLIVASAYVTDSGQHSSTLKLSAFLDLKQNALPTSNRKPENGDMVILNYMYESSLLIAPSRDAFIATREKFKDNNFLHSDIFASKLKKMGEPLPSKELIQNYAISQNLGTIFFVIDSKVYVVDTKTFSILETYPISYNFIENKKMPFYTRIEKIEKNIFKSIADYKAWLSFINSFLGDDEKSEEEELLEDEIKSGELSVEGKIYNNYYKSILGIKK